MNSTNTPDKYRVVKVNGDYIDSEDYYTIVLASDIEEGYYHDTYTDYGVSLTPEEAGDYTFGTNFFDCDLKDAIKKHFHTKLDLSDLVIERDCICNNDIDDELDEFISFYEDELMEFIANFADEHECFARCTYINYWNGHNWNSVYLADPENYIDLYDILDEEDDTALEIIDAYLNGERTNENDEIYYHEFTAGKWNFVISHTESDSWNICKVIISTNHDA